MNNVSKRAGWTAVSATVTADCPFSVALQASIDFLNRRGDAYLGAFVPHPLPGYVGRPFGIRRDKMCLTQDADTTEPGRRHDEIRFHCDSFWYIRDFRGTIRFRIASYRTRINVDGQYDKPVGVLGKMTEAFIRRPIARMTVQRLADTLAAQLEETHRLWLEASGQMFVGHPEKLPIQEAIRSAMPVRRLVKH